MYTSLKVQINFPLPKRHAYFLGPQWLPYLRQFFLSKINVNLVFRLKSLILPQWSYTTLTPLLLLREHYGSFVIFGYPVYNHYFTSIPLPMARYVFAHKLKPKFCINQDQDLKLICYHDDPLPPVKDVE